MMASPQPSGSQPTTQEYTVRVPKNINKRFSLLKFNPSNKVDFTKCGAAKIERENNLREFKLSYDIDVMPKFGGGSEFGREQREEARRKKYGVQRKSYNPEAQPWLLKLGSGKQTRKFKGSKEGGVTENASYYIFTQCSDGAFEAHPVEEWFNFAPVIKYSYLNSEEAEEEFSRRDRTLNYFSIMMKKRLTNNKDDDDPDEGEKKTKKKSKKKDFLLTDLDEWAILDEDEEDSDGSHPDAADSDSEKNRKKKEGAKKGKASKKKKRNSDSEAEEDSDDIDEGKEVDYMTDTDSEDEDMYAEPGRAKSDKYEEKGVEDEEGLRKVIDSGDEEEEEEKKEGEEEEPDEKEGQEAKAKKEDSDSDSSGPPSDSDSDVEKEANIASALFMQGDKKKGSRRGSASSEGTTGSATNSRSATPTVVSDDLKGKKRRTGIDVTDSPSSKRPRSETPTNVPTLSPISGSSDGISEEAVRRYLMRKPMTTFQLLQKFKSTGLSKEQLVNTLTQILKRLNPEKINIKDKLYLSIKSTN